MDMSLVPSAVLGSEGGGHGNPVESVPALMELIISSGRHLQSLVSMWSYLPWPPPCPPPCGLREGIRLV